MAKNHKLLKGIFPDQLKSYSGVSKVARINANDSSLWQESLLTGWSPYSTTKKTSRWQVGIYISFFIISFSALLLRLFHLQIAHGSQNRELADSNRIQVKVLHAPRGVIYDRNGKILAQNEPGFRLIENIPAGGQHARFLNREEALKLEAEGNPGFKNLEVDSLRAYPLEEKTSHILGYVSEISEDELNKPQYKNYKIGDKIGRGGIEQVYEKVLRGSDGGEIIEVDSFGKKLRTLSQKSAIPGSNIYLTIDANLQDIAFKALQEGANKNKSCCAAAVAEIPASGEILALLSVPSFNPGELEAALTDPEAPMFNRAIAGEYPPGSTYKIISSLAGLQSGKITPDTQFEDTGVITLGPYKFANWYFTEYGKTEGMVDLLTALKRSNDIYYYRVGQLVGEVKLADVSLKFGLGKPLGIDLPGEAGGVVPDNEWKVKNTGQIWYPGDTLHMSIGQGFILTTPLQILHLTVLTANEGKASLPHLVQKITDPSGKITKEYSYDQVLVKGFKKEDFQIIKKGLELVPKTGGTAWPFFDFPIPTAGKTGTAEFGDPKGRTHAWYTSYAPVDNPRIALTVLVEGGGEGSTVAGAISKEIYKLYFFQDKSMNMDLDNTQHGSESARRMGE